MPTVVAHPLLVAILRGHRQTFYQHGELVTPAESVVRGAAAVFVPTSEAARPFLEAGYNDDQVVITGLCIESALNALSKDAKRRRLERYASGAPLTGAFFSSGAEPRVHVEKLVAAATSAVRAGGTTLIFAREHGWLHTHFVTAARKSAMHWQVITAAKAPLLHLSGPALILYDSREQLERRTQHLFKFFDYIVTPAHERTNWAVGLGLPMFVVTPDIGPFAPRNHELMRRHKVSHALDNLQSASEFADALSSLRHSGELARMADPADAPRKLDGFNRAASEIRSRVGV